MMNFHEKKSLFCDKGMLAESSNYFQKNGQYRQLNKGAWHTMICVLGNCDREFDNIH